MNKYFKREISFRLTKVDFIVADSEVGKQVEFKFDLKNDSIEIRRIDERKLHFALTRRVSSIPAGVMELLVLVDVSLTYADDYQLQSEHDQAFWLDILYNQCGAIMEVPCRISSVIISNITNTFGSRIPVITPPNIYQNKTEDNATVVRGKGKKR